MQSARSQFPSPPFVAESRMWWPSGAYLECATVTAILGPANRSVQPHPPEARLLLRSDTSALVLMRDVWEIEAQTSTETTGYRLTRLTRHRHPGVGEN